MSNILVTGATGNIGKEIIKSVLNIDTDMNVIAGVRDISRARKILDDYGSLEYRIFDFEDSESFDRSLDGIDTIFLLRPPHISDVDKIFRPLFEKMKMNGITKVVFLSVQGAEKSKIIPHNKIEKLINEFEFSSIMLRPSYFMQNITTTLIDDVKRNRIVLPSGNAKFNWIDIEDIGEVGAQVIDQFDIYSGEAIELTGLENLSFKTVVMYINELLDTNMVYKSVNPFRYYRIKKADGLVRGQVIVMVLLHFLPRLQSEPVISKNVERVTGHSPRNIKDFILRNRDVLKNNVNG